MAKYERMISKEDAEELLKGSPADSSEENEDQVDDVNEDDTDMEDVDEGSDEPSEDDDNSDEQPVKDTKYSEGFLKKYKGKSADELLDILHNQESFIGKKTAELSQIKKQQTQGTTPTVDNAISELEGKFRALQDEIDKVDIIVDPDKYRDLQKQKDSLQEEKQKLNFKKYMAEEIALRQNNQTFDKVKKYYEDKIKFPIEDEDWETIKGNALSLSRDGILSEEDIDSAVMRAVGREQYLTAIHAQGGKNERQDIATAQKIGRIPSIGSKSSATSTDIYALPESKARRAISSMPDDQLDKLYEKAFGVKKKK